MSNVSQPSTRVLIPESLPSFDKPTPPLWIAVAWRIWNARRLVLAATLIGGVAGFLASFLLPQRFTALASFTPESPSSTRSLSALGGLAGLASQFGLPSGLLGSAQPDYYAAVLSSREVLEDLLNSRFRIPASAKDSASLEKILGISGKTPLERNEKGVRLLRKRVQPVVDKRTGIVDIRVTLSSPTLSAAVANRLLAILNDFNISRKQSQSRAQRQFTEQRRAQAEAELRAAENEELHFLQANRSYRGSPLLEYEAARLQRVVQQKQDVFAALSQAYEEARIAEVQDTPVLTVLDSAVAPVRPSFPGHSLVGITAALLGAAVGIAWSLSGQSRRA